MFDMWFPRHWSTLKKLIWLKASALAGAVYETVTGAIATFTTLQAAPLKDLLVNIDPVQDLHGYDNPWTAGGGENKMPAFTAESKTLGTTTCSMDGNGTFTLKAVADSTARTFTFDITPFTTPTGTCYIHLLNSAANNGVTMSFRDASDGTIGGSFALSGSSPNKIIALTEEQKGQVVSKIRVYKNAAQTDFEITFSPMLLETNAATTTYIPYSNICPITGHTGVNVWVQPTHDTTADPTVSVTFPNPPGTIYGGTLDVLNGVLTVTHTNIASYNGESINEPWMSSMDKYVAGITPSTGAQVVYPLTTPLTVQLTANEVSTLLGENNIWADAGNVTVEYRSN